VTTLQSAAAELSEVRDELDASKKERSSLQTKIIQLTTALKSILTTKVGLNCSLFIAWPVVGKNCCNRYIIICCCQSADEKHAASFVTLVDEQKVSVGGKFIY